MLAAGAGGCDRPAATSGATADTVTLARGVEIGEVTGDERYQFGYVAGVAADGAGRVYVADRMGSFVRVYGSDGRFLRQIGREGEGPGEFSYPSDLLFDDRGRLWVRDSRRATVFAPPSGGAIPDSVVETRAFDGYTNWTSSDRSRLIDGIYYYPAYTVRDGESDRYFYTGYGENGPTADTIDVPDYETLQAGTEAYYRISAGSGRMVYGLNRAPFEPAATWELTSRGTILGGAGMSRIVETDRSGDTLTVLRLSDRRLVSDAERADSARALRARIDSLPVPLSRVHGVAERVRSGVLPDTVPGFLAIHTSSEGAMWVRRWPPEGQSGAWFDVYAGDGELLLHVRLPHAVLSDPPPFIGDGRFVGVVRDAETDVHRVVVYRLARTSSHR